MLPYGVQGTKGSYFIFSCFSCIANSVFDLPVQLIPSQGISFCCIFFVKKNTKRYGKIQVPDKSFKNNK